MNDYAWSDLAVGMRDSFSVALDRDMLASFRSLSGDDNPLHSDPEEAARRGYPDVVAFGMLTSVFYSRLVGVHLPGRRCLLHGIQVDFVAPAFAGDALTVAGEITHLTEAYRQAEIRATMQNQRGELVSRARIRVGVHA
jgi:acyl dehydratase